MNRRNFLSSMLAACAAPAIVRADSLMRIVPRDAVIVWPVSDAAQLDVLYGYASRMPYNEIIQAAMRQLALKIEEDVSAAFGGNNRMWKELPHG